MYGGVYPPIFPVSSLHFSRTIRYSTSLACPEAAAKCSGYSPRVSMSPVVPLYYVKFQSKISNPSYRGPPGTVSVSPEIWVHADALMALNNIWEASMYFGIVWFETRPHVKSLKFIEFIPQTSKCSLIWWWRCKRGAYSWLTMRWPTYYSYFWHKH